MLKKKLIRLNINCDTITVIVHCAYISDKKLFANLRNEICMNKQFVLKKIKKKIGECLAQIGIS